MSVLPQITTALTDALGDSLWIAGVALLFYVTFFVFRFMRRAMSPQTINRHGETYVLDESYQKKLPKYQYFEGQRYVLKSPPDDLDPYEVDEDQSDKDDFQNDLDSNYYDQLWADHVELSRQEFNR